MVIFKISTIRPAVKRAAKWTAIRWHRCRHRHHLRAWIRADPRSQEELIAMLRWQYHRSRLRDLGDLRAKVILQVQIT
jgi:hypothetical protein